jgi:hypothetical protein
MAEHKDESQSIQLPSGLTLKKSLAIPSYASGKRLSAFVLQFKAGAEGEDQFRSDLKDYGAAISSAYLGSSSLVLIECNTEVWQSISQDERFIWGSAVPPSFKLSSFDSGGSASDEVTVACSTAKGINPSQRPSTDTPSILLKDLEAALKAAAVAHKGVNKDPSDANRWEVRTTRKQTQSVADAVAKLPLIVLVTQRANAPA